MQWDLQLFIARWGLGSSGRTEAQGGCPGKEKDLGDMEIGHERLLVKGEEG